MNNDLFWVAMCAYALHILEEYFYDWKNWARSVLKLQVDWNGFYLTNSAVLFLGIACAGIGWNNPLFSLAYPGLMLINAVFFHIMPVIRTKRFSPGLFTACLFFLPVGITLFYHAGEAGVPLKIMLGAFGIAAFIMAFPIILIKTKGHALFNQKDVATNPELIAEGSKSI